MANLPFPPNQTADVYHGGSPPSPPDVSGVPIYLQEQYTNIKPSSPYTHVAHFAVGVDIRDSDHLFVPTYQDAAKVLYSVTFVARRGKGTGQDHKVAYLQRTTPTWPTDNL